MGPALSSRSYHKTFYYFLALGSLTKRIRALVLAWDTTMTILSMVTSRSALSQGMLADAKFSSLKLTLYYQPSNQCRVYLPSRLAANAGLYPLSNLLIMPTKAVAHS